MSRRVGHWVYSVCGGSESWWGLHLSNPLQRSNLGNINLKSPEPLCKSPDENSGTTFHLNHANPGDGTDGESQPSWLCVTCAGGHVRDVCGFLLLSVWWTEKEGWICLRGELEEENSSSWWHEAGRQVHFLTGLTPSQQGKSYTLSLSHTQTHGFLRGKFL